MDKNLTKFHKRLKNLSPIGREKSKNYINGDKREITKSRKDKQGMVDQDSRQKSSSLSRKFRNSIQREEKKTKSDNYNYDSKGNINKSVKNDNDFTSVRYPTNINEYRHIMSNFQTVGSELNWILHLRASEKLNYSSLKNVPDAKSTRFYSETIENFKSHIKSKDDKYLPKGNISLYNHLITPRSCGTVNSSQISFETTLRNFSINKNNNWNNATVYSKPRLFSSYLPYTKTNNIETFLGTKFITPSNSLRQQVPKFDVISSHN